MTIRIAVVLILLGGMGVRLEAQTRSPELRFHVGTGFFFDSDTQRFYGASYRHYFGERGWAIEPEYSFMTDAEGFHKDHLLILNAVKDLTLPSRRAVLYTIMGGGLIAHRHGIERFQKKVSLVWGMGVKVWASDRFFISPQFNLLAPTTVSVHFGVARRR